jgi:hypothetical protein
VPVVSPISVEDEVPQTSIEDEDTSNDIVNELHVLAEVKLPSKARKSSFHCFCNHLIQ